MSSLTTYKVKSIQEHKQHFIQRLKERYGISINDSEWDVINKQYTGFFRRNSSNSIGWVMIQNQKVWCMYSLTEHAIMTALPAEIETDFIAMIKISFKKDVRDIAIDIYKTYLKESKELPEFNDPKLAADYIWNKTLFAPLHMEQWRHKQVRQVRILQQIKDIIYNNSAFVKLAVVKR